MTCHRKDVCSAGKHCSEERQAAFAKLSESAEQRRKQEAEWTRALQRASNLPGSKRTGRDIRDALTVVAQVAWYGLRMTAAVCLEMIVRMIRKGLGMKRSETHRKETRRDSRT
jgi:hypothetical protein